MDIDKWKFGAGEFMFRHYQRGGWIIGFKVHLYFSRLFLCPALCSDEEKKK